MFKRMNKRAISSIVTMTLIILGTIVSVAFLWKFVNKTTSSQSDGVNDLDCLSVSLQMVECKAYGACSYYFGSGVYEAEVIVKRRIGKGNVTGLRFIFESSLGRKGTYDVNVTSSFNELESVSYKGYSSVPVQSGDPNLVRVVALVGDKKEACPIQSKSIKCPIYSGMLPFGNVANSSAPYASSSNRAGNCCQWPKNLSACYDGGDPAYVFDPVTRIYLNNTIPQGNKTICCQSIPY